MRLTPLFLMAAPLALAACSDDSPVTAPNPVSQPETSSPAGAEFGVGGGPGAAGAVFVLSNAAAGNAVLVFPRAPDGSLGEPQSVPTGGLGTGAGLGNQGALAIAAGGRFLFAVNAGSDEISAFRLTAGGLEHIGNVGSGGDLPISLALSGDLLYALNDGAPANVTGFRIGPDGSLSLIAGSTRPLSIALPDAAQVGISPGGDRLVVTEKGTNTIVSWDITAAGALVNRTLTPSASPTPFGFAFDSRGTLLVSEAVGGAVDASVLSSYRPGGAGWAAVSPSVATTETAACWVAVTPNGKFTYVTNTGSNSVSGYAVGQDGSLELLDSDGVTGTTGGAPIDADVSRNGSYLYTLDSGADALSIFRIAADGSLESLGAVPGLPDGATGLIAL